MYCNSNEWAIEKGVSLYSIKVLFFLFFLDIKDHIDIID